MNDPNPCGMSPFNSPSLQMFVYGQRSARRRRLAAAPVIGERYVDVRLCDRGGYHVPLPARFEVGSVSTIASSALVVKARERQSSLCRDK